MHRSNHNRVSSRKAAGPIRSAIALDLAEAASLSHRAVIVRNSAGIVEWANAAWTRITGFAIEETVAKPISHFLGQASIELDLVDFVGQNFLEGQACSIEFPFFTFDDRSIWVHLEVQPIRNAEGEVATFVATATDISQRHHQETDVRRVPDRPAEKGDAIGRSQSTAGSRSVHNTDDAERTRMRSRDVRLCLNTQTRIVCDRFIRLAGPRTHFDIDLDPRLPTVGSDRILLGEIIRILIRAATVEIGDDWGFVTVMTGWTRPGRSHVSAAHPIPARAAQFKDGPGLFLEVHDSAPMRVSASLESIRDEIRMEPKRAESIALASALADAIGGSLHLDDTPGCGTQALLLLPVEPSR